MKKVVRVCMGSACHVKGAPEIAHAMMKAIEERDLAGEIELMGRFCGDECARGVVVEGPFRSWYEVKLEDLPEILDALMEEDYR